MNPQSLVKAICSALTEHGPSHWPALAAGRGGLAEDHSGRRSGKLGHRAGDAGRHHHQVRHGDLKVPPDWEEGGVRLGVELDKLRRKARADKDDLDRLAQELGNEEKARKEWMARGPRIHPDLVRYLAERGFVWEPRADGRAVLLGAARAYVETHGHLLPRKDENVDGEEVALGALLAERRRPGIKDPELDTIGALPASEGMPRPASWTWRVPEDKPWTAAFHRQLVRLERFKNEGGTRAELLHGTRFYRGEDLGKWLYEQHVRWKELHEEQRVELGRLRMGPAAWDARVASAVPQARRGRKERLMEIVIAPRSGTSPRPVSSSTRQGRSRWQPTTGPKWAGAKYGSRSGSTPRATDTPATRRTSRPCSLVSACPGQMLQIRKEHPTDHCGAEPSPSAIPVPVVRAGGRRSRSSPETRRPSGTSSSAIRSEVVAQGDGCSNCAGPGCPDLKRPGATGIGRPPRTPCSPRTT
ncbi:hypothetical protein AB0E67_35075 [Streptomyces sp. NPDC032161]|uniref:helicase associated domain-containing protein n=1 Tax=unclassified Streptomyces TaxID=2593676 RepID=UPI0033E48F10